jgi:arabinofuranosyltransferase
MRVPVAPAWPAPVRWYATLFDRQQSWLIDHYVCMRHQEHRVNMEYVRGIFPPRDLNRVFTADPLPVLVFPAVGYAAWALPRINILDTHGLNDYVVARTPVDPAAKRAMAHDRQPPPGYLDCFSPNVRVQPSRKVEVIPRAKALTEADVRNCEEAWAARVASQFQK